MLQALTTGIQHIGIPTNDLAATVAFYEGLGFAVANRETNNGVRVAFLQLHGLMIEAYQNGAAAMRDGAIDHIAIDVTDLERVYDAVAAAGYAVDEQRQALPYWEHGVRFFKIRGVNGESIEFCQRL